MVSKKISQIAKEMWLWRDRRLLNPIPLVSFCGREIPLGFDHSSTILGGIETEKGDKQK
jgi:hypothetical protein